MERIDISKDSRLNWIGEIPKNWKVLPLRRLVLEHRQGFYTSDEYVDNGTKMLRITDINDLAEVSFENCPQVKIADKDFEYFKISDGDFLFARSGTIGRFGVVKNASEAIFASYLIKFSFKKTLAEPDFLKNYFFSSLFSSGLLSDLHGGANQNINAENIKNQLLVLPELEEQKKIASFLDNKMRAILKIIKQKELLLEKLQDKRQAIINEAVTKGIHPNVPIKPSGIEWLGDIPAHWETKKLKYLITKAGSGVTPRGGADVYVNEGVPLLRSQNIYDDGLRLSDVAYITESMHEEMNGSKVLKGDVLLNITGASIGRCYYYNGELGEANVNQHVCIIRPKNDLILTQYLHRVLCSSVGNVQIDILQTGANREGLNGIQLKSFIIPLPSLQEQEEIIESANKKLNKIEKVESLLNAQLDKLKLYRQSLISEVVIGKIKVV